MKKLFWWNLDDQEKATRSFILAPIFGAIAFFVFIYSPLSTLNVLGIVTVSVLLMLAQGLYYRRKLVKIKNN